MPQLNSLMEVLRGRNLDGGKRPRAGPEAGRTGDELAASWSQEHHGTSKDH